MEAWGAGQAEGGAWVAAVAAVSGAAAEACQAVLLAPAVGPQAGVEMAAADSAAGAAVEAHEAKASEGVAAKVAVARAGEGMAAAAAWVEGCLALLRVPMGETPSSAYLML